MVHPWTLTLVELGTAHPLIVKNVRLRPIGLLPSYRKAIGT
jgi:hypothetical protein